MLRSLVGLAVVSLAATVASADEVTTFTLPNGMQGIVIEDHRAPVVTHMVWYRAGAADEKRGKSGIAHFLEHLMFKGTKDVPDGQFSKLVEANGGYDNAFTTEDQTAYFQRLAADRLDLVMKMEADRMRNLILSDSDVTTERDVILEERSQRIDSQPEALFSEQLDAAQYLNHPYGTPTIGWRSEMEQLTRQDALDWYQHYYAPNNATLIVVGDIKADTLLPTIAKLFEPIPKGPSPKPLAVTEAPQHGERRFLLKREAQVPFVMMGYRVPNYSSDDSYALNVLESILSHGKSARLYQSLVYEQKTALAVGADYGLMQADPGLFYFYAVVKPGEKVEAVEDAVLKEIQRIQTEPPSELELQRAKNQIEAAHIFEQDSNFRQAMLLGEAETIGAGWRKVNQFVERTRAVTAQDVQRVASHYLAADMRTTGTLIPQPPQTQAASPTQPH
jgi:zinc protease